MQVRPAGDGTASGRRVPAQLLQYQGADAAVAVLRCAAACSLVARSVALQTSPQPLLPAGPSPRSAQGLKHQQCTASRPRMEPPVFREIGGPPKGVRDSRPIMHARGGGGASPVAISRPPDAALWIRLEVQGASLPLPRMLTPKVLGMAIPDCQWRNIPHTPAAARTPPAAAVRACCARGGRSGRHLSSPSSALFSCSTTSAGPAAPAWPASH